LIKLDYANFYAMIDVKIVMQEKVPRLRSG